MVDFDFATSCHFMPRQVACHFEWRMPLQVACHFEWHATPGAYATSSCVPLRVAHATSSGASRREHATSCQFKWRMPLRVPWRTREYATSCHFKSRMPLRVACRTLSLPLHATSSGVKWREVAKSVYAPAACSMRSNPVIIQCSIQSL